MIPGQRLDDTVLDAAGKVPIQVDRPLAPGRGHGMWPVRVEALGGTLVIGHAHHAVIAVCAAMTTHVGLLCAILVIVGEVVRLVLADIAKLFLKTSQYFIYHYYTDNYKQFCSNAYDSDDDATRNIIDNKIFEDAQVIRK